VEVDWEKVIEYKNYPRGLAFCSRKHNKIYINPITRKYQDYHKFLLEHEKGHYVIYNKHKTRIIQFFLNLAHDWYSSFTQYKIPKEERKKCNEEFRKIRFSEKEKEEFDSEFLPKKFSGEWFEQKLYEHFRPERFFKYFLFILCIIAFFYLLYFKDVRLFFMIINQAAIVLFCVCLLFICIGRISTRDC